MEITNNYMDYDEVEQQEEAVKTVRMLMTVVNGMDFAVSFDDVLEIAPAGEIFPVPEFPDYVPGFARIGDKTVPVIDARKRFGFPPAGDGDRRCIVVSCDGDMGGLRIGLLVDAVLRFRNTPEDDVKPVPKVNDEAYTRYVTGMFRRSNGSICYVVSPKLMYSLTEREVLMGGDGGDSGDSISIEL